jgi:endonuclease/exonuclease/phosphatase family metal-dependent hydrolase
MGLQEVTALQLNYLTSKLSDYAEYGVDRGNSQSPGSNAGERTSIMYNKQTVEVLDKGTFWLSDTPEVSSRSWNDTGSTGYAADAMKYHRTCTWIKFKRKSDNKVFFYYNTHLEFGYHANYNLGQNAREKGIALIVERMKAKATNGEALIFGGDMNQIANDKCFKPLFNNGFVSGRVTATTVTSEQNRNSITWNDYDASYHDKEDKNNYSPNSFNMIDHFFLKNCEAVEFRTIRDTNYGGEIDPKNNGGKYMADHFPILITVAM